MEGLGSFSVDGKDPTRRINVESGAQNQCRVAWSHLGFLIGEGNLSCLQVTEAGSRMSCRRGSLCFGTGMVGRGSRVEGGGPGGSRAFQLAQGWGGGDQM